MSTAAETIYRAYMTLHENGHLTMGELITKLRNVSGFQDWYVAYKQRGKAVAVPSGTLDAIRAVVVEETQDGAVLTVGSVVDDPAFRGHVRGACDNQLRDPRATPEAKLMARWLGTLLDILAPASQRVAS